MFLYFVENNVVKKKRNTLPVPYALRKPPHDTLHAAVSAPLQLNAASAIAKRLRPPDRIER